MRVLEASELGLVSGGDGNAAGCGNAIIGAGGMGGLIGGIIGAAIGAVLGAGAGAAPGAVAGSGIGALLAGGYVAENGEVCQTGETAGGGGGGGR